jgi:putative nucleotidyltransferase with HDIG domain
VSTFDETLPIINRLTIFESFSDEEKRQIVSDDAHFRAYQPDEVLIRAGSRDRNLFVLLTGEVSITDSSGETILAVLKAGDIFGEMAFLTDTRRTANVVAKEFVIALKLDRILFDRLSPQIREKFKDRIIEKLVSRLDRANKELSRMESGSERQTATAGSGPQSVYTPSLKKGRPNSFLHGRKLIREIISRTSELPAIPEVMMKVQKRIRMKGTTPLHLTKIIETDPAIVAGILKMANSAYYGFRGKVSTVRHAAALFGTRRLGELVTAMSSKGMLGKAMDGYEVKTGDMWRHAIAVSRLASEIAAIAEPDAAENVQMAGLLHDVGKLILDPYVHERKVLFDHYFKENADTSLQEAERDVFGFDHAAIAAVLCESWDLPRAISFGIRHHHQPSDAGEHKLTHIVHVSDVAVNQAGLRCSGYATRQVLNPPSCTMIPIAPDTVSAMAENACEYARALAGKVLAAR